MKIGKHMKVIPLFLISLMTTINASAATGEAGEFPWVTFLESLKTEFTGPIPLVFGAISTAIVAYMLFSGNAGDATKRFIGIIFGVSLALVLPSLLTDVSGFLIGGL